MDSEATPSTPKLSLFSIRTTKASSEYPWTATPPHRSFLSVPFRWEEEPGKPLPCLALATIPTETTPKSLELPPRLLFTEAKLPSPTTVLDGPYVGRQRFQSSSFRSLGSPEKGSSSSPGSLGALVVSKRRDRGFKGKGLFGSLLVKGSGRNNKETSGGSCVFPSSSGNGESDDASRVGSEKVKMARIRRGGSFSALSSHPNHPASHFWGTIYEGFKRAVPWRSKKWNRVI